MKIKSAHSGFTLIELIFVIVIIGVLAAVAVPRFANLTDNAKISSELATASSVQSALDAIHSEWITNTCDFDWGNGQNTASNPLNINGYPAAFNNGTDPFGKLFKKSTSDWVMYDCEGNMCFKGPATNGGTKDRNIPGKPEGNDYWEYNATSGVFKLVEPL